CGTTIKPAMNNDAYSVWLCAPGSRQQPAAAKRRPQSLHLFRLRFLIPIPVFAEVEDTVVTLGLLALSRVASSGIVDFLGANPAQGNERRDAQRGSAKEYGARGKILAR